MSSKKKKAATKLADANPPLTTSTAKTKLPVAALIAMAALLVGSVLLFANLGHYAIWDDEAMVTLAAKGILKSGDTLMMPDDHNLVAYRNGALLRDLHDRSTPPLASYLTAASFALFGQSSFSARLPFSLFGVGTIALLLFWGYKASRENVAPAKGKASPPASWLPIALVALGTLGNVSLLLFSRQCRYYSLAIFFSLAVTYCYVHWKGSKKTLAWMALCSVLLFVSNYLNYLALYVCIAVDYFLWTRKERALQVRDWALLLLPQVLVCTPLVFIWNPLRTQFGGYVQQNTFGEKLILLFRHCRDLNQAEFLCGVLFLVALGLVFARKDKWLIRASCALGIYLLVITALSPQTVKLTSVADVRYLIPLIPLCIGIAVRTILLTTGQSVFLALGLAGIAFGSNLLNGGPLLISGTRSTIAEFVKELANPPSDPYRAAAAWINQNVQEGQSIWTLPDYMPYPLMFHASKAVYGWQLEAKNHDPQFAKLAPIQFQGRIPPDYILVFGPTVQQIRAMLPQWQGVRYEQVALIDCFWKDLYRPELFWRTFTPITGYNRETDAIYVFKKQ